MVNQHSPRGVAILGMLISGVLIFLRVAVYRSRHQSTRTVRAPAELLDSFAATEPRLDGVDFAARAPRVGNEAPDFTLPDQRGDDVSLRALLGAGPVVLIFYHGESCPYCSRQLRMFEARLHQFAEFGAQVVAVSPQTPEHSLSIANENDLKVLVLSDVGADVIDRYGLTFAGDAQTRATFGSVGADVGGYNDPSGWVLPAAATFIIGRDGVVGYAGLPGNWCERADPLDVLSVLSELRYRSVR